MLNYQRVLDLIWWCFSPNRGHPTDGQTRAHLGGVSMFPDSLSVLLQVRNGWTCFWRGSNSWKLYIINIINYRHVVGLVFSFIFLVNGCLDMFCSILLEPTGLGPWGLGALQYSLKPQALQPNSEIEPEASTCWRTNPGRSCWLQHELWVWWWSVMDTLHLWLYINMYIYICILQYHGFRFLSLTQFICRIIHTFCACVCLFPVFLSMEAFRSVCTAHENWNHAGIACVRWP